MRCALLILLVVLFGCGRKQLLLPDDSIQRAATCGVVAAANAREGASDINAKLTIDQQGHILHYALLAGAEGGVFDKSRSAAVVNAMPRIGDRITAGNWQALIPACNQAYPSALATAVDLPRDRLEGQAGCLALDEFLTTALRSQEAAYQERMRAYDALARKLDAAVGVAAKAQGIASSHVPELRNRALARVVPLGPPTAVLDQCLKTYNSG